MSNHIDKENFEKNKREIDEFLAFLYLFDKSNQDEISLQRLGLPDSDILQEFDVYKYYYDDGNRLDRFKYSSHINKVFKATVYLLLYNLVEGTISNFLIQVIMKIDEEELKLSDLSSKIILLYLKSKYSKEIKQKNSDIMAQIASIAAKKVSFRPDNAQEASLPMLSEDLLKQIYGNISRAKIVDISSKFGFDIDVISEEIFDKLELVLKKRNELSHGNKSFNEVGQGDTIEGLIRIKKDIYILLDTLASILDDYINNRKYKS